MHRNLAVWLVHDRETRSTSSQVNEHDGDSLLSVIGSEQWLSLFLLSIFATSNLVLFFKINFSRNAYALVSLIYGKYWIWRKKWNQMFKGCESQHLPSTCQMPSNTPGGNQNVSNPLILTSSTASPALSRWEDWGSKRLSWLLKMKGWSRVYILQGCMMPKLSIHLFKKTI